MSLIWPNGSTSIPRVTSEFNPVRKHPKTGRIQPHNGIDLAGPKGRPQDWTAILSPVAGVVTRREYQPDGAGHWLEVREANTGDVFRFFHLKSRSPLGVGQSVAPRGVVGVMGETGSATAVHLHFETRPGGGGAINPRSYYANRTTGGSMSVPNQTEQWRQFQVLAGTINNMSSQLATMSLRVENLAAWVYAGGKGVDDLIAAEGTLAQLVLEMHRLLGADQALNAIGPTESSKTVTARILTQLEQLATSIDSLKVAP